MYSNLRSLIFKLDPEKAHTLAIQSLKFNLVSNVFDENKNDPIFKTQIFGKDLSNPIGIAAGFDKNAEVYNPLFKLGFGFVEVGTVTPLKQYGNEKPRVFRLVEDQALINRLGFNNQGSETILNRIKSNPGIYIEGVGVNAKVFTKGVSSINNQKEVLFILNGVQVGTFSQIVNILNPESIKSITVLKNANDIAIYGFRGSGGVILIKTK